MKKEKTICKNCSKEVEYDESSLMMSFEKPGSYYVVCPDCKAINYIEKQKE